MVGVFKYKENEVGAIVPVNIVKNVFARSVIAVGAEERYVKLILGNILLFLKVS